MLVRTSSNRPLLSTLLTTLPGFQRVTSRNAAPIRTESPVEVERLTGDWYVIASVPTSIEKGAFNAMKRYELDDDGTVKTTFSFLKGGFEGQKRQYKSRGFILDAASKAVWGMRFVWPFTLDYRIVYVADDYSQAIIGRNKRDFAWIIARTPTISNTDFFDRAQTLRERGYDTGKLQLVPQQWDSESAP